MATVAGSVNNFTEQAVDQVKPTNQVKYWQKKGNFCADKRWHFLSAAARCIFSYKVNDEAFIMKEVLLVAQFSREDYFCNLDICSR